MQNHCSHDPSTTVNVGVDTIPLYSVRKIAIGSGTANVWHFFMTFYGHCLKRSKCVIGGGCAFLPVLAAGCAVLYQSVVKERTAGTKGTTFASAHAVPMVVGFAEFRKQPSPATAESFPRRHSLLGCHSALFVRSSGNVRCIGAALIITSNRLWTFAPLCVFLCPLRVLLHPSIKITPSY